MVVPSDKYFPATVSCQIPEDGNEDGICFSVLGKNVHFTQKEFNIITGLWPTNNPLEKDCDSKRLQSLLFGSENKKLITCLEIEEIFKNFEFTNDDNVVKVTLAVFIETVMVGKDKKTQFDSKGLIPRILRWNCTQAPFYKMLQKNIFDNKNVSKTYQRSFNTIIRSFNTITLQTVVQPKLKMSTQEIAFMESRIRGVDNMEMEDDESIGAMNNKLLEQ
ncbi:hypothetical protein IC582_004349 [Cucumis melo]